MVTHLQHLTKWTVLNLYAFLNTNLCAWWKSLIVFLYDDIRGQYDRILWHGKMTCAPYMGFWRRQTTWHVLWHVQVVKQYHMRSEMGRICGNMVWNMKSGVTIEGDIPEWHMWHDIRNKNVHYYMAYEFCNNLLKCYQHSYKSYISSYNRYSKP